METQSQASSAAEKKKRVETIVAAKGSSARCDISEKAVASSTTSNGKCRLNYRLELSGWPSLARQEDYGLYFILETLPHESAHLSRLVLLFLLN